LGSFLKKLFARTAFIVCICASFGLAQEPTPVTPGATPASTPAATDTQPASPTDPSGVENAVTEDHRMFKVLPNYKTVNDPSQPITPIDAKQKFALVLHYFDPFTYGFTAIQAGIQQLSDAQKGYGQGVLGYNKRYFADFTDAFTNELFTVGVFPTLLHEDPRYFRSGKGSGLRRTMYAISRVFVARTDAGTERYNFSEVLGNVASGSISELYYPRGDRHVSDIFTRTGFQIGYDAMFNVMKEFYPDLKRKFSHHKDSASIP
jgi:hypothetical protein